MQNSPIYRSPMVMYLQHIAQMKKDNDWSGLLDALAVGAAFIFFVLGLVSAHVWMPMLGMVAQNLGLIKFY